jgi:hypothetical protein
MPAMQTFFPRVPLETSLKITKKCGALYAPIDSIASEIHNVKALLEEVSLRLCVDQTRLQV